jgi:glycosyltransferase involved in cell wall biosynthesis
MKIAQISSIYLSIPPKTHGGTERIVFELCQHLTKRGHQLELFAAGDSQVDCSLQSVLSVATSDDPQSTFYLEKEFEGRNTYNLYRQAGRFDLIHAHWPTLAPYFSAFSDTPTLITYAYIERELHEYYRDHFPHCFPVCISRAQARMLGDESLPVIYNGIAVKEIPFNDQPEDFFIVVGRMTPGKGIVEAIRIVRKANARLLIVGQITSHLPWSEKYFSNEIQPHIDGDRIRHIKSLPHDQLMQTIGRAKGFLFPTQAEEAFGLAVAEAMAAGTPVLAYSRGSMPELVKDGESGYLISTEEEMIQAMHRIESLDRKRCRQWVQENFSVEQMVDGYERLYRRIAAGARS